MVMYFGQNGKSEYYPPSDIGRDDGQSEVTMRNDEYLSCLECWYYTPEGCSKSGVPAGETCLTVMKDEQVSK